MEILSKWCWCPSIEKQPIDISWRYYGFKTFAFGVVLYLGKREYVIRLAVPR